MFIGAVNRRVQNIVLACVFAMTLLVTPWANLDPINLPKFLVLVVSGFALLGNLLPYLGWLVKSEARWIVYFGLFFIFALLFVFLVNGSFLQVYGSYGRNTGLLAYLSLVLILLAVVSVSNLKFVEKLVWTLIATGVVNAVYGLIQWAGMDPVDWNNPYNPIVGTLGNPNFTSAHLGIAGLASLALALGVVSSGIRLVLALNVLLSLFVIYKSDASQGLLIFALGTTVIFYYRFVRSLVSVVRYGYWSVVFVISGLGVFGILNKGPLAGALYQDSVTYRGDYWRAGWKMTVDNPLFGVGLDAYGDWYRFARNEAAALRRGPDVTSNSAHNVFLDISSNGGFLLLIAYLLIIGLVIRSAIRVLRGSVGFDAVGVGLITAWLAYLVQSIISINQLGLAIWGWALGGAIIGYDLYKDRPDVSRVKRVKGKRPEQVPASVVITGALGLVVGFALAVWPVAKDVSFRSALQSGDPAKIEGAASSFPEITYYYIYGAQIFLDNKLEDKALDMAKKAIEINDQDFNAYKALVANPKASEADKEAALVKMKELDPFNNTLGK